MTPKQWSAVILRMNCVVGERCRSDTSRTVRSGVGAVQVIMPE